MNRLANETVSVNGIGSTDAHPAARRLTELLAYALAKLGLLRDDAEYHLLRAAMVIIFFFFGYQKWFAYEVDRLIPFISNGPLIFWLYPLLGMRGVVLGLAYLDPQAATMTWLGVGNIGGLVLHADATSRPPRIGLVPTAGFVGAEEPHPTSRVVPLTAGDTIVLFSDGIRDGFAESLTLPDTPQSIADFIITRHVKGTDDALVLVARYAR